MATTIHLYSSKLLRSERAVSPYSKYIFRLASSYQWLLYWVKLVMLAHSFPEWVPNKEAPESNGLCSSGLPTKPRHVWTTEMDMASEVEAGAITKQERFFLTSIRHLLITLNCDAREDSWESLGLQGDPTSQS